MKLKYFASALVLMTTAGSAFAQTAEDLRIYINPGHGSWTGNDRPMNIVGKPEYSSTNTDTTGFFESNTDLEKGFGVLEKLIEMGFSFDRTLNQTGERWEIGAAKDLSQQLVMSRVKNGPFEDNNTTSSPNYMLYNRSLLEIAKEVEYNEFDQFISIHSNAAGSGEHSRVNYHLFMYRGRNEGNGGPEIPESWDMCEAAAKYSFANEHAQWSESKVYINGDVDFMSSSKTGSYNELGYWGYLGVLKHGCPGYLVEGYFHTHSPSRHRGMNWDVDRVEGYQYARGVAEYFELDERDHTGEIYGIVRDAHTKFVHKYWIPDAGTDDVLMPINGVKVHLWKDGEEIADYTTDDFYNGAFVFIGLEPGSYQVTFEHEGYLPGDPVDVEVAEGLTTYPKVYLTDLYYNGRPGEELVYPNLVSADDAELLESYKPEIQYTDYPVEEIAGLTPLRMQWIKGNLYILAADADNNPTIVVFDDYNGKTLAKVDLTGIEGSIKNVSDIAVTGDGHLLAITKDLCQADGYEPTDTERGYFKVYTWENDDNGVPTGAPVLYLKSENAGEWRKANNGETIVYSGTFTDGSLLVASESTASSGGLHNIVFTFVDGKLDATTVSRPSGLYASKLGEGYRYVLSPLDRYQFFVTSNSGSFRIQEFDFDHTLNGTYLSQTPSSVGTQNIGAGFFKYADHALMTMAAPGEESTTLALYDVTHGLPRAEAITIENGEIAGGASKVLTTGYPEAEVDDEGNVTSSNFVMLVLRDDKLTRFTTGTPNAGVADVVVDSDAPAVYYDLNGRRVQTGALTPGIYVRLQGGVASKIVVK